MAKQTFVCDFGDGLTCTTVVNPTRLFQGKNHVVGMEWSVKPTSESLARILPRYREWIHSINQVMVEKTRQKLLYCLQTHSRVDGSLQGAWEILCYKPGSPPELNVIEGQP